MSKVRVKTKAINAKADYMGEISSLVAEMSSDSGGSPHIMCGKYDRMILALSKVVDESEKFETDCKFLSDTDLRKLKLFRDNLNIVISNDLILKNEIDITTYKCEEYKKIKHNMLNKDGSFDKSISHCMYVTEKVSPYYNECFMGEEMRGTFLKRWGSEECVLFKFCPDLDLKKLWNMKSKHIKANDKKVILNFIKVIYDAGQVIFTISTTPDIDANLMRDSISKAIDDVCDSMPHHQVNHAKRALKGCIGSYTDNFDGYYKEYAETDDSSVFLTSFLKDASEKTREEGDLKAVAQFRTIITNIKQKQQYNSKASSGKTQKLFSMFNELEEKYQTKVQNPKEEELYKKEDLADIERINKMLHES